MKEDFSSFHLPGEDEFGDMGAFDDRELMRDASADYSLGGRGSSSRYVGPPART